MPCTKEELITAINSYAAARTTGDAALGQMAAVKLTELIDTITFAEPPAEANDDGSQE
jgi:hypothetical protein